MPLEAISQLARSMGAATLGTARVDDLPDRFPLLSPDLVRGLSTGLSVAVRLSGRVLDEIRDRPTRLYFHHYRRVNHMLDMIAHTIMAKLLEEGFEAVPIPASQTVDWEHQAGHLSHKVIAAKAGLGWIGRNNLLVTPHWGAQVRLVTVLTDAEYDRPSVMKDSCGECRACVYACPVGAIGESRRDFDRDRCMAKVKELSKLAGIGHYICGICVKACRGDRS